MWKKAIAIKNLVFKGGKRVDGFLKSAKKGYKYLKLYEAFIKHLEAFNNDRKKIMGVTDTLETKTE
ncbi:hypothetical protein [Tenacibaculum ovolyticum]|uniref:hypothetical protein n=1 Tax=Tenacibaculum ovolyticum TaxID=104270 RepID=UPI003BA8DA75